MPDSEPRDFAVWADFTSSTVVVGVRGEVDLMSAPRLGAALRAVIDQGHPSVVLDLGECDFMDAAGLRVIAGAARGLRLRHGRRLTIRSVSPTTRRILGISGLNVSTDLELPVADAARPASAGPAPTGPAPTGSSPATVLDDLTAEGATLVVDDMVDASLRLVVALARASVEGADGVSVSLRRQGQLATVAASDQTILSMDADQYASAEGPCVDAATEGRRLYAEALDSETRWPSFVPQARDLGINAILSSPLLVGGEPVGALNMYSRTSGAFDEDDQALAALFSNEASAILAGFGSHADAELLTDRLAEALRSRNTIALAQGSLMERLGLDPTGAYTWLRRRSLDSGRPLRDEAEAVVSSTQTPPGGSGGGSDG
jgi:anti-anti-sigma factor